MYRRDQTHVGNVKGKKSIPEFQTPTHQSPNPYSETTVRHNDRVQESFSDTLSLYQYYLSKEKVGHVNPTYLTNIQTAVKHENRCKAVDIIYWFHRFSNHRFDKTFILAIRILDRFMSIVKVSTDREFYKLTVTCIYLASKYEECYLCYGINDILEQLHKTLKLEFFKYSKKDFFEAEVKILKVLEYRLAVPTIHEFVSLMSENASPDLRKIIRYITMYSCREYSLLRFDLSVLSCSIVYLSEAILNDWNWDYFDHNNLSERVWKKNPIEVKKCARILWNLISKGRFTTLRIIMSNSKCSQQNRELSVTELVDLWGQKILFLESQKKQNNNLMATTTNSNNSISNNSPMMFVNYGIGGLVINNFSNVANNNNQNNNRNPSLVIRNRYNNGGVYYPSGRK